MNQQAKHLIKSLIEARAFVKGCALQDDIEQVWEAYVEIAAVVYSHEVYNTVNIQVNDEESE